MAPSNDFDALARTRTHALMDALERVRTESLQTEIDALNAFLATRARESQKAAIEALAGSLVEPLVTELCAAARTEAAERVRAVEARAAQAIDALKEQSAVEQRRLGELHGSAVAELEETRRQLEAVRQQSSAELERTGAQHRAAVEELEEARRQLQAAREQSAKEMTALEEQRRAVVEELEETRRQLQSARVQASEQAVRAERAEAEAELAQTASAALLADMEEAREARAAAERTLAEAASARDEAIAAATVLTARLEAAERDALGARADAGALSAGATAARAEVLDRLTTAVHAMQDAESGEAVFDVVVDRLAASFGRAAILIAGPAGLKCWLQRGFGDALAAGAVVQSPLSPAMRALETATIVEAAAAADAPVSGLGGSSVAIALALPVVARERTIAIAYAECADAIAPEELEAVRKEAEVLVEVGSRRVNGKRRRDDLSIVEPRPGAPSGSDPDVVYAVQRQARRVKMREAVNITLDGSASFLIDLSTLGAQVLSPVPLRPKQEVQIALVIGERAVDCRGRIVWALFEQPKGTRGALYRAGVEFVHVDTRGVEAFLSTESHRLQRSA